MFSINISIDRVNSGFFEYLLNKLFSDTNIPDLKVILNQVILGNRIFSDCSFYIVVTPLSLYMWQNYYIQRLGFVGSFW